MFYKIIANSFLMVFLKQETYPQYIESQQLMNRSELFIQIFKIGSGLRYNWLNFFYFHSFKVTYFLCSFSGKDVCEITKLLRVTSYC